MSSSPVPATIRTSNGSAKNAPGFIRAAVESSATDVMVSPAAHTPPPEPMIPGWPRVRGYEVLSLVGAGGMGVVFKARHKTLQRTVALKTLRGSVLDDPQYRERFQAEAEAVARLLHPNIIQVFEVGTVQGAPGELHPSPFIALEFVEGGSLSQHTARPQPPRDAAAMVEKLARAAHAAHRVGVVHRDLKPANVLLTRDGEPKIADFGVAKQIHAECDSAQRFLTQDGMAVGTPEYMAPEQVAGEHPTPAIDVYALGVILYELLTTRVPFRGSTPAQTMYFVQTQEPVSPRRLQPAVPRDLETICLKCLAKSPGRRYESAEALADDLANWLGGRTIRARPVGAVVRTARWAKRNPTVAALWAAVVLTALIGVAGVVWKWRDAEGHAKSATAAANEAQAHYHAERFERYRANLVAAASAVQLHNVGAARRALEAAPEEYRNWEWHYFMHRLDTAQEVIPGHAYPIFYAYMSNDGRRVAQLAAGQEWTLIGVNERRILKDYPNQSEWYKMAWSDDGRLYLHRSQSENGTVIAITDTATGRLVHTLRGHTGTVGTARFSPDNRRVATGAEDHTIRIWNLETGTCEQVLHGSKVSPGTLSFSPDGRRLVSAGRTERLLRLWNLNTGELLAEIPGHERDASYCFFNHCGDRILSHELYPVNDLRLWDGETGQFIAVLKGHANQIHAWRFSDDDRRLVTGSLDQTVRVWDGRDGTPIAELNGHTEGITAACFNRDGTRIMTASQDKTLRIWNAENYKCLSVLHGHTDKVMRADYTDDGRSIVSASHDCSIRIWDARDSERDNRLLGHESFVYAVAFHPDGRRVISAAWDGTLRLWDATSGRELRRFVTGEKTANTGVAIHPDGRRMASIGRDHTLRLWNIDTGEMLHSWKIRTDGWRDTRLAFSRDGRYIACGDDNCQVRIFDVEARTERPPLTGHTDIVRDMAFSPCGRWLVTGGEYNDRSIRIWDAKTFELVRVIAGHIDRVYAIAFSPDGKWLATGGWDQTVHVWDVGTWNLRAVLKHGTNVYGIAFTPDCTRLASACADNSIRFWDTKTFQEVAELRGHTSYVHSLAFSPDGTRLVSGSGDFSLRMWDTLPSQERKK